MGKMRTLNRFSQKTMGGGRAVTITVCESGGLEEMRERDITLAISHVKNTDSRLVYLIPTDVSTFSYC